MQELLGSYLQHLVLHATGVRQLLLLVYVTIDHEGELVKEKVQIHVACCEVRLFVEWSVELLRGAASIV